MLAQFFHRIAVFPRIYFLFGTIGSSWITLVVSKPAISEALNKRRPAALPGAVDSFASRLIDCQHVVAVDLHPGHVVSRPAARDIDVFSSSIETHLGRVQIVLANEDGWQLPRGRHIDSFVKGAVIDGPVAEERNRNLSALPEFGA